MAGNPPPLSPDINCHNLEAIERLAGRPDQGNNYNLANELQAYLKEINKNSRLKTCGLANNPLLKDFDFHNLEVIERLAGRPAKTLQPTEWK